MQESRYMERRDDGLSKQVIERLAGVESPELMRAFSNQAGTLRRRLENGEIEQLEIRETRRIGRNDPCPCGSNVKFKECCGARLAPDDPRIVEGGDD